MSNLYLVAAETIKPLVFALPNRFASLYTTLFTAQGPTGDGDKDKVNAALNLQRMANDMESIQPSLAAELRSFASRS
jgi:hypothetical protein